MFRHLRKSLTLEPIQGFILVLQYQNRLLEN
jgi:hypothetical protein